MRNPLILGCDPSITGTGLAILNNEGVFETELFKPKAPKKGEVDRRIEYIVRASKIFLDKWKPDVLAIETQYINPRSIFGAIKVILVRGVLTGLYISYCIERGIAPIIIEVTPMEAKQAVGAAVGIKDSKESKARVKAEVIKRFPKLEGISQDECDAVAVGLSGMVTYAIERNFKT